MCIYRERDPSMGWFIAMHKRRAQQRWAPSHPHVEMGGLLTINFLGWCKWHSFTHIISYWRFKPPWPHWLFLEIFLCYICSKMRLPIVLPCSSACKCGKKIASLLHWKNHFTVFWFQAPLFTQSFLCLTKHPTLHWHPQPSLNSRSPEDSLWWATGHSPAKTRPVLPSCPNFWQADLVTFNVSEIQRG